MRIHVDRTGQMTIPRPFLDHLGVGAGGEIEFKVGADGRTYVERADAALSVPRDGLDRIRGSLKSDLSTDDIMRMTRGEE